MNTDLTVFFVLGTVLIAALAITLVLILIVTTRRKIRDRLEKQRMQLKFEEDLLHTRIEMQEQALQNFSGEIHDGIGQELSLARIQLRRLRAFIPSEEGQRLLKAHSESIKNVIKDLRLLSHSLNTGLILNKGLEEAIEFELNRVRNFSDLQYTFDISGVCRDLSAPKELLLFRIFQESIQNILKHASAQRIAVGLSYSPQSIRMTIEDNGKGFTPENQDTANQSLGLGNMTYRTNMLGGSLQIHSTLGAGTRIDVSAPC